jgi:hypothetical protein
LYFLNDGASYKITDLSELVEYWYIPPNADATVTGP